MEAFFPSFIKLLLSCLIALSTAITGTAPKEMILGHSNPSFTPATYYFDCSEPIDKQALSSIYGNLDSSLPSYFNLKDRITLFVEDQGSSDLCDMYANIKSIETNYALKTGNSCNLSEDYLNLLSSKLLYGKREPDSVNDGSTMYFASRYGLPLDVDFRGIPISPVSVPVIKDASCVCRVDSTISFTEITTKTQDSETLLKIFKLHIMKYGSLCTGITPPYEDNDFFNEATNAYYKKLSKDEMFGGHQISIVGFDDNYPAKNFKTKPSRDGAFICLNSWGSEWGDSGYFYISYDNLKDFHMVEGVLATSECCNEQVCTYASDHYNTCSLINGSRKNNCYAVSYKVPEGCEYLDRMILSFTINPSVINIYCNPGGDDFDRSKCIYLGKTEVSAWGVSLFTLKEPLKLTGNSFSLIFEIEYSEVIPDDFLSLSNSLDKAEKPISGHFYNSSGLSSKYKLMDSDLIMYAFCR